ncbi:phosphoglycerate mutase 2 isoform X6 [Phacochoerus africanus]|uniref:phosphoglycerate mutase 2 isoform X6 n=1 Tax=Phacochoerus africanus TaxID=41426 RepID=UPI001FD8ED1D|nr:phosphoglycerate mutase 2 isoform X6 [Phacochoerus africanus]
MNSRFQISPKSRAGAVRPWSTLWEPCDYWSCSSRCTWEHSQGSRPRGLAVVKRTKSRQYVELWFESGQRQSSTTCPWHCSEGGLHLQAGVQSLRLRTRSWEPPHWAGSSAGRSIRTSLTSARTQAPVALVPNTRRQNSWACTRLHCRLVPTSAYLRVLLVVLAGRNELGWVKSVAGVDENSAKGHGRRKPSAPLSGPGSQARGAAQLSPCPPLLPPPTGPDLPQGHGSRPGSALSNISSFSVP